MKRAVFIFLVFSMLSCSACITNSEDIDVSKSVETMLFNIKQESDAQKRSELSYQLIKFVSQHSEDDLKRIDANVIDEIIGLLEDNSDDVRATAATLLLYTGAPADKALPALEKALKKVDETRLSALGGFLSSSVDSEQVIRKAIAKIRKDQESNKQ